MMTCFDEYFKYLSNPDVSAESFLRVILQIDPPAAQPGAVWYLLVADFLSSGEY